MAKAKAAEKLNSPVNISVKQVYFTSNEFDKRLQACAKKKGLKDTDISRIAVDEYLTKEGY